MNQDIDSAQKEYAIIQQARCELSAIEHTLKNTITTHTEYVDKLGKKSSGAKGLAMQINIRIKKAFAHDRDSMSHDEILLLKPLLTKLNQIITTGEVAMKSRKGIKTELYQTIESYGRLVQGNNHE